MVWGTPCSEGHSSAVLCQHLGVRRIRFRPPKRLSKSVRYFRVQNRQFDSIGRMQSHREVEGVYSGCLQGDSHSCLPLAKPCDQKFMSGCIVGKLALFDELLFPLDCDSQADGTDINTAEQPPWQDHGLLAHRAPPTLGFGFDSVPDRFHGLTLFADLEHAGSTASDSPRRNERGTAAALCDRLRITPASGGYGLSAET